MIQTEQEQETQINAGKRSAMVENTRAYMGSTISMLIRGNETDGRIDFLEYKAKVGNEPPPHTHNWENEIYYVLEGELEFFCEGIPGSTIIGPNEMMIVPAGKAHTFYIHSSTVRTIMMTHATGKQPVKLDGFFVEMSEPAKTMELDEEQTTYGESDPKKAFELALQYGGAFLTPEEAAERLPDYPGFGANLR